VGLSRFEARQYIAKRRSKSFAALVKAPDAMSTSFDCANGLSLWKPRSNRRQN
jgi:hypothetical protein